MTHRSDARKELLVIIGLLAAASGVATTLLLGVIKRPLPSVAGAFVLFVISVALVIGGVWLARLRRWAGGVIAVLSLTATVLDLVGLARCESCTPGVLAANLVIAGMFAIPAAAIIRWRRFLR
jgi:hypothetical protein